MIKKVMLTREEAWRLYHSPERARVLGDYTRQEDVGFWLPEKADYHYFMTADHKFALYLTPAEIQLLDQNQKMERVWGVILCIAFLPGLWFFGGSFLDNVIEKNPQYWQFRLLGAGLLGLSAWSLMGLITTACHRWQQLKAVYHKYQIGF